MTSFYPKHLGRMAFETHMAAHDARVKADRVIEKDGLDIQCRVDYIDLIFEGESKEDYEALTLWLSKQKLRFAK